MSSIFIIFLQAKLYMQLRPPQFYTVYWQEVKVNQEKC